MFGLVWRENPELKRGMENVTKFPFMMYMAVNSSFSRDLDFEYKYWYSLFFHGNKYILKAFFL